MIQIAICDDEPVMCRHIKEKLSALLESRNMPYSIDCHTSSSKLLNTAAAAAAIW